MSFSLGLKDAVKFSVEIEILEYVISAVGFSNTTNSETILRIVSSETVQKS